jgi:hypothetical protein
MAHYGPAFFINPSDALMAKRSSMPSTVSKRNTFAAV